MKFRTLPVRLSSIKIPKYISPSKCFDITECPLKAFAVADDIQGSLPKSPHQIFGLFLHSVREEFLQGRWGSASDSQEAIDYIFQFELTCLNDTLNNIEEYKGITPLEHTIGRSKWNTRRFELRKWAQHQIIYSTEQPPNPISIMRLSSHKNSSTPDDNPLIQFGPESWIICPDLRICGKADFVKKTSDGRLEISDYKTGYTKANMPRQFVDQVQLYALAVSRILSEAQIELFIEGRVRIPVDWDEDIKQRVLTDLLQILEKFPQDKLINAIDLGNPGTRCIGCQLRTVCSAYITTAPDWWANENNPPRPLPFDVWGNIEQLKVKSDRITLELRDAANRGVLVDGLDRNENWEELKVGDEIYFFDLEPSESDYMHGRRIQPRNYHEYPNDGGASQKMATTLCTYI